MKNGALSTTIATYGREGGGECVDVGTGELLSLLRAQVVCQASTAMIATY